MNIRPLHDKLIVERLEVENSLRAESYSLLNPSKNQTVAKLLRWG